MPESGELPLREALVLTLSRIHRCRSLDQLRRVFLSDIPRLVGADAYGLYLFDSEQNPETVISYRAKPRFLTEYEKHRATDPLFREVLTKKAFTHSLALYSESEWAQQSLYGFLSRWGLAFSIEAPLLVGETVVGTINFATSDKHYFSRDTLDMARFLCEELNVACGRLIEYGRLTATLPTRVGGPEGISPRARQVIELAASGLTNREIALRMKISENTVRYHLKRIYRSWGIRNRAQLVSRLYENSGNA